MTIRHAAVMGAVAGLTAVLVLLLVSLVLFFSVGTTNKPHVELGPDGRPTYTTVP